MSEARNAIFARLQQALAQERSQQASQETVNTRLSSPPRGPQAGVPADMLTQFSIKASAAASTVAQTDSPASVVHTIQEYLIAHALAPSLVIAPTPQLLSLPWPQDMQVEHRAALAHDTTAVTIAFAGVAETGSLVLLSGPQTPTSLNFLPENYVCLVSRSHIVCHMEDVWSLIREQHGGMPRTLNFITGPSRTADVEQTIQLGAHGPRRVLIIITE